MKRQCQGRLIHNDMSDGDREALVCVWCGTTYDAGPDTKVGQPCTAMFKPTRRGLGDLVGQARMRQGETFDQEANVCT